MLYGEHSVSVLCDHQIAQFFPIRERNGVIVIAVVILRIYDEKLYTRTNKINAILRY